MYRDRMRISVRPGNRSPGVMETMHTSAAASTPQSRSSRRGTFTLIALGVCVAALLAAFATVAVGTAFASAVAPFAPTVQDGLVAEGAVARLTDGGVPAIDRLDPALRAAMLQAEADAAAEGVAFEVTSGWRSPRYQQWLYEEAVEQYGSADVARQFVATPDRSSHVTGGAVDIAPLAAQFWLVEHGARYGICQTYANERWHFELVTEPGAECPTMKADAAS